MGPTITTTTTLSITMATLAAVKMRLLISYIARKCGSLNGFRKKQARLINFVHITVIVHVPEHKLG